MRSLAEETHQKTDQLLLTSPVSLHGIILGKYFASVALFWLTLLVTGLYPLILRMFGSIDAWEIFATLNIYAAIITALSGGVVMAIVYLINKTLYEGFTSRFLGWFSLLRRYEGLSMGILDVNSIIYYITFSAAFVFLAIRMIDKRRWS